MTHSRASILTHVGTLALLVLLLCCGDVWSSCRVEERSNISLVSVTNPARVISVLEMEDSRGDCYRRCCEYQGGDEDSCTTVSSYMNGDVRICVLLHCIPFRNCAWKSKADFVAAKITRGASRVTGTTTATITTATTTTATTTAATTATMTGMTETDTATGMEYSGNQSSSVAGMTPLVEIDNTTNSTDYDDWNFIGDAATTSTTTTTKIQVANEDPHLPENIDHDILLSPPSTDTGNNNNNNNNVNTDGNDAHDDDNNDNIRFPLPDYPGPDENDHADSILPQFPQLPDESDTTVHEFEELPGEIPDAGRTKEQNPQSTAEPDGGLDETPTVWSSDDLRLFEVGLTTADKFYVVMAIFAIVATLVVLTLVMFKKLTRKSRSYRRLRDFDASSDERSASSSALLQREF